MRVVVIKGEDLEFKNFPSDFPHWRDINTGQVVLNISSKDEAYWNSQGIYRVVDVTPDPATEKKGEGFLDGNVYTFEIIPKTPEEIAQYNQQQLNSDVSQQQIDKRRLEGAIYYDQVMAKIERMYRSGTITGQQAIAAVSYFDPLIEALNRGGWVISQVKLNAVQSIPAGYNQVFNEIKIKVDTYVQNNY